VESLSDDFDIEQTDIVKIIESKERRTETAGRGEFGWNKFNGDIACRVVKQFMKKHLPDLVKVVGPNAYIDGYPVECDLLLVTEGAIPEAFTNAYRDEDVRGVIKVKSHGDMTREFPEQLLSQFTALQMQFPNVNCTYLTIRETSGPKRDASISYVRELKEALEPRYRVFCLSESRTHGIILGQWREFVNHLSACR
jgi:hypothetical protein